MKEFQYTIKAVSYTHLGGGEAQLFGGEIPVQRVGSACQCTRAQRALAVHAGGGVRKAVKVAQQHGSIGHQRVAEGDGLGMLQVLSLIHIYSGSSAITPPSP